MTVIIVTVRRGTCIIAILGSTRETRSVAFHLIETAQAPVAPWARGEFFRERMIAVIHKVNRVIHSHVIVRVLRRTQHVRGDREKTEK